jgi:hypothetical protein
MLQRIFLSFSVLLCVWGNAIAQKTPSPEDLKTLAALEDSMAVFADSIHKAIFPDEKSSYNVKFVKLLKTALAINGSYSYPFEKIKDKIHILSPEDNRFRIFNWVLVADDFRRRYYGAIQMNTEDGSLQLYPLTDASESMVNNGMEKQVTNKEWYGCEYYRILTNTDPSGNKVYTLFGYNNDGSYSTRKVLDPLMFTSAGPIFGWPIFAYAEDRDQLRGTALLKRFILEYKKFASVALNYDDTRKKIMFDRLISEINEPKRKNSLVPSGHTDAFSWQNGVWVYDPDPVPALKLKDGEAPINGVMPGG